MGAADTAGAAGTTGVVGAAGAAGTAGTTEPAGDTGSAGADRRAGGVASATDMADAGGVASATDMADAASAASASRRAGGRGSDATPPPRARLDPYRQSHTSTQTAKTRRNARSSLSVGRLRGEMHYLSGLLQRIALFREPRAGKTAPRRRRKRPTPAQNRAFRQYLATQKVRACISMIICQTKEGREAKSGQCARNTPHAQRTTYWREERERATAPRSPERTSVATMHTRSGAIYNSGMQYRAS